MKLHKHPAGLPVLFLTEMWERFGFYIMQGMLVLYLTNAWHWSDNDSYAIAGAFTAFAYLSPIAGGYLANKILGYKTAIIFGGILLIIGYATIAIFGETFFYMALAILIIGNGFLKPNIGSLLGTFYTKGDTRRESGFTIFYMGINTGAILATISSGFIKDWLGWWSGFALASGGLVIGVITFVVGAVKFKQFGCAPQKESTKQSKLAWLYSKNTVFLGALICIPILSFLIQKKSLANSLLGVAALVLIILLIMIIARQPEKQTRHQMSALVFLFIISIFFWAILFQIFFSLNLFVDRDVNRTLFGHEIPPIAFISLEPIFVLLFAPFLARLWFHLDQKKRNPSIPMKFFLSFVSAGICFLILALGSHFPHAGGLISPWWIFFGYCFITLGEMLMSPISLAAVTALAPERWVGMMMGVYLIGIGYGGKLAGVIANFSAVPEHLTNKIVEIQYYGNAFFKFALFSFLASIVVLICVPFLNRLIMKPKT